MCHGPSLLTDWLRTDLVNDFGSWIPVAQEREHALLVLCQEIRLRVIMVLHARYAQSASSWIFSQLSNGSSPFAPNVTLPIPRICRIHVRPALILGGIAAGYTCTQYLHSFGMVQSGKFHASLIIARSTSEVAY